MYHKPSMCQALLPLFTSPAGVRASAQCVAAVLTGTSGCQGFNRDDQLTSRLYFSSAYQKAPCPERCFHFTGPPTPQLPLDVYTDPFIEDSLGLLPLFVCMYLCVCVCVHIAPLGHNTACLHWALWSDNVGSVAPDQSQILRARRCAMKEWTRTNGHSGLNHLDVSKSYKATGKI